MLHDRIVAVAPPLLTGAVELRDLRFAMLAADLHSFARAALHLGIKQTTLSKHVAYLERRFGAALFVRSTRGVTPTEAGQVFLASARRVLDEMDGLYKKTHAVGLGEAGGVAFGFETSISAGNLRSSLLAFEAEHPHVLLHGVEDERQLLLTSLETGVLDILIVSGSVSYDPFYRLSLWSERVLVALRADHPLASREPIYWSDLRDEVFLAPKVTGADLLAMVQSRFPQPGTMPFVRVTRVSRETVLGGVGANRGITVVAAGALGLRVENVVFRELHDATGPHLLDFSAYWRTDNNNPALRTLLAFLCKRYALVLPGA